MARVLMHSSSHSQVTVNLATVTVRQFTCICSHIGRSLNLFLSGWVRMWIVDVLSFVLLHVSSVRLETVFKGRYPYMLCYLEMSRGPRRLVGAGKVRCGCQHFC